MVYVAMTKVPSALEMKTPIKRREMIAAALLDFLGVVSEDMEPESRSSSWDVVLMTEVAL